VFIAANLLFITISLTCHVAWYHCVWNTSSITPRAHLLSIINACMSFCYCRL